MRLSTGLFGNATCKATLSIFKNSQHTNKNMRTIPGSKKSEMISEAALVLSREQSRFENRDTETGA